MLSRVRGIVAVSCLLAGVVAGASACVESIEVTLIDGTSVRGRVVKLAPEFKLLTDAGERALTWSDILSVAPIASAASANPPAEPFGQWRLALADGAQFGAVFESSNDASAIAIRLASGAKVRLRLSDIRWAAARAAPRGILDGIGALSAEADPTEDAVLLLRNGEPVVLRGTIKSCDAERVQFQWKDRELAVSWEKLSAIFVARPTAREASVRVRMRDGDVFAGRVADGDTETLVLQSGILERLSLSWAAIERIECRSTRMMFLSDLQPRAIEFRPYFSKRWEPAMDRTLSGRRIVLGGREFAKGVTLHSASRLVYAIGGAARQFAATVGIVDEMGPRGNADLKLIGDGRVLWEARGVRGGEAPREVLVDVSGVEVLELLVEFGDELDLSDQVCWAFARLIR